VNAWQAALHARAGVPPAAPRLPLWAGGVQIGTVAPETMRLLMLSGNPGLPEALRESKQISTSNDAAANGAPGWHIDGPLTASLAVVARALHGAGLAQAWRDEQLAVRALDGPDTVLGTVERAAVRPLGIATRAVHLAGRTADGRHWVQRRSLTKPNDPGLWDTLMGGMVPAADTLAQALARETWEEAGLRMEQLAAVTHGGWVAIRRPTPAGTAWGYMVEQIDWFHCTVPDGVLPANQDGEVDEFRLMPPAEVLARLEREEFTLEASLVLTAAGGFEPAR